ncbi:MAG: trypsin-like peptidase domain-containing protein [Vampirovibrionales bacterium]|nr:trypsin-like peptidase domain-containing protein [Vampirovibrionales bacterium]
MQTQAQTMQVMQPFKSQSLQYLMSQYAPFKNKTVKNVSISALLATSLLLSMAVPLTPFSDNPSINWLGRAEAKLPESFGAMVFSPNLVADVAEAVAPSVVNIDVQRKETINLPFIFGDDVFQRFFGFGQGGFGQSAPGFSVLPAPSNPSTPGPDSEQGTSPFFHFRTYPPNQVPSPNSQAPQAPGALPAPKPPVPQQAGPLQERILSGNGSGVILDKRGHILTNNHVVTGSDKITVTMDDGSKLPATVVGTDSYTDLAVIRLDKPPADLTPVSPASEAAIGKLRPGEWVLAVGSPLGFDHTVTLGIISALSRRVPDVNSNVEFIQTDAAINPGNSGGPLVNLKGEVVGINTAISGRAQNIGFAIPMDTAQKVATALIQNGGIKRPWIGISMAELNPTLAKSLGISQDTPGVIVAQVLQNSPAAKAGFRQGDVIQRIDGLMVDKATNIQQLVQSKPLHTTLNFQILRNGHLMALPVTVEQMPDLGQAPQ